MQIFHTQDLAFETIIFGVSAPPSKQIRLFAYTKGTVLFMDTKGTVLFMDTKGTVLFMIVT